MNCSIRKIFRIAALASFALLGVQTGTVRADEGSVCAPEKLVKIITTAEIPGAPRDAFARAPKTVYRQGTRYGRVEEGFNPATNLKLLIVVDEPHLWVANLAVDRGNYIHDAGPTYYFRARLFGDGAVSTVFARSLEYGCEVEGMLRAGAKEKEVKDPTFGAVMRLEAFSDNEKIVLLTGRNHRPLRLELFSDNKLVYVLNYEDYQTGLAFDKKLFEKPADVKFDREPAG